MTVRTRRFTNRGISTIIAALLLIAIAIAAGVLLYVFSMGLIGSLQGSGGQEVNDQLIMEAYNWGTAGTLVLQLRNAGATTINLSGADFYLAGQGPQTGAGLISECTSGSSPAAVVPGGACAATLVATATSYTAGVAYVLKIGLQDGGVFSYSCVDGSAV